MKRWMYLAAGLGLGLAALSIPTEQAPACSIACRAGNVDLQFVGVQLKSGAPKVEPMEWPENAKFHSYGRFRGYSMDTGMGGFDDVSFEIFAGEG